MALNTFRIVLLAFAALLVWYSYFGNDLQNQRNVRAPTGALVPSFCKNAGQVAITFDDGPSEFTQYVLASLAELDTKATFHVVTRYLSKDVATITNLQVAAKAGHVIGLRWNTQVDPTALSDDTFVQNLLTDSEAIFQAIGKYPKFLRLPYGSETASNGRLAALAQQQGFVVSTWNIDTNDSAAKSVNDIVSVYNATMDQIQWGSSRYISLHHDLVGLYQDPTALPKVVNAIKTRAYTPVTLDVCLSESSAYRTSNVKVGGDNAGGGGSGSGTVGGRSSDAASLSTWTAAAMALVACAMSLF